MIRKFIAPLVAALAIGGAVAVPAQAHLGDYNAQYAKTYAESTRSLETYAQYRFHSTVFVWSGAYGDHSRQFHYMVRFSNVTTNYPTRCEWAVNIDHNLGMFSRRWVACWNGW